MFFKHALALFLSYPSIFYKKSRPCISVPEYFYTVYEFYFYLEQIIITNTVSSHILLLYVGAIFYKTKRAEDLSSSALMQLTGLEPVPSQPGLDP